MLREPIRAGNHAPEANGRVTSGFRTKALRSASIARSHAKPRLVSTLRRSTSPAMAYERPALGAGRGDGADWAERRRPAA